MPGTERLYPDVKHPGGSLTAPMSAMGEKLRAEADKWRAMSDEAIATSKRTPAPAEPAAPPPPPVVNWDAELDREALITRRRQPTDWSPTTVELAAGAIAQVVAVRVNRKSVTVLNTGTNPCLLGATSGAVANQTSSTFPLATGSTLSMETEAAIWAISAAGTTLQVIETYYGAQHLGRAVTELVRLALARTGPPKAVGPEAPVKRGEKGLL